MNNSNKSRNDEIILNKGIYRLKFENKKLLRLRNSKFLLKHFEHMSWLTTFDQLRHFYFRILNSYSG